ncbi:Glutamate-rich WD repeat-containing protein 1 [Halotydeus destructor]|nr:Glutamate-rich WD repeat-containing protein 1 [Halotydeus destructor]
MSQEEEKVPDELLETDSEDDAMFLSDSEDDGDDDDGANEEEEMDDGLVEALEGNADDNGANGDEHEVQSTRRTYIPNSVNRENPEDLEYDESAYVMYHKAECGYPCLSFDVIKDDLGSGEGRSNAYPLTVHLVAGTQAPKANANKLLVMKMSNLVKTRKKQEDDDEGGDSDGEGDLPNLACAQIPHAGAVNRVRTAVLGTTQVAATWSELGKVHIWDLTQQLQAVSDPETMKIYSKKKEPIKPVMNFIGHRIEGYGLSWSPVATGFLASGDCKKNIHIWRPQEDFSWHVDQQPLVGHTASVEDIQWSPTEANILASCSVDKSIRLWDIREKPAKCMLTVPGAHESDINVISWNKKEPAFLLSGGDDGAVKTWDLRQFGKSKSPQSIATFKHHVGAITSIEWHPTDSTVFGAAGDDNQITLWDLAVERDEALEQNGSNADGVVAVEDDAQLNKLPPQLLFIHQGQNEIKEIHWHSQIPGLVISTALSGFDVFRTISV